MNTMTLKHDRKKRTEKQLAEMRLRHEAHEIQERRGYLRAAAKMAGVKGRAINVMDLTREQELELLTTYAESLESEMSDFLENWPGKEGQRAARWFALEKSRVLDQIVKLKIGLAKE